MVLGRPRKPITKERITERVIINENGCWEWTGASIPAGYGFIASNRKMYYTHRVAYELWNGPIGEKMSVCHRCDNPCCCNPEHLFVGTAQDNALDMVRKGRCKNKKGEEHWNAIMTVEKVIEIKRLIKQGIRGNEIAKMFGVSQQVISAIKLGKCWTHVLLVEEEAVEHL